MRGSVNWELLCPSGTVGPCAWTVFAGWRQRGFTNQETGWGGRLYLSLCGHPLPITGCRNSGNRFPRYPGIGRIKQSGLEVCPRYTRFLGSCLARRGRDGPGMAVREKPKSPIVSLRQAGLCHPSVAPRPCSLALALLPRPLGRFLYFGVVGAWQREAGGSQLTH